MTAATLVRCRRRTRGVAFSASPALRWRFRQFSNLWHRRRASLLVHVPRFVGVLCVLCARYEDAQSGRLKPLLGCFVVCRGLHAHSSFFLHETVLLEGGRLEGSQEDRGWYGGAARSSVRLASAELLVVWRLGRAS